MQNAPNNPQKVSHLDLGTEELNEELNLVLRQHLPFG